MLLIRGTHWQKDLSPEEYQKVMSRCPFVESKEAIAGYILLQVNDLNEALEIAKECPGLLPLSGRFVAFQTQGLEARDDRRGLHAQQGGGAGGAKDFSAGLC
jgi:hypothetical protein